MALVQKVSALIKVLFLKGKALEGTCRIKVSREKSFLNLPSPWLLSSAGVHDPLGKGNCVPPHCSSEGPASARPATSRPAAAHGCEEGPWGKSLHCWHLGSDAPLWDGAVLGTARPQETSDVCAQSLNHVWLFTTPWTVARQAPLSMEFSKQERWSGLPFPSLEDLPDPGIEAALPALAGRFFTTGPPGKPSKLWRPKMSSDTATHFLGSKSPSLPNWPSLVFETWR